MTDQEKLQAIDEIHQRFKNMTFPQFRTYLDHINIKFNEIQKDDDATDAYIAFQTLKKCMAMFLTWDEYWDKVAEANGIDLSDSTKDK
jgi:hypothetical protein